MSFKIRRKLASRKQRVERRLAGVRHLTYQAGGVASAVRSFEVEPGLLVTDAIDANITEAVKQTAKRAGKNGTFWFVFIDHGAPSPDGKGGVLVGADAQQTARGLFARSVQQNELLKLAGAGPAKQSVFIVDACFSGRTSYGTAIARGLQPVILDEWDVAKASSKAIVFTAAKSASRRILCASRLPSLRSNGVISV